MNDRDCDNCAHHSDGGCSVWECSFTQKEDDTISRQAAVDAVCGWCHAVCTPCEYFPCGEIKTVQELPSAQPDGIPLEWIDKHLEWLDNCDNDFAQLAKVSIRAMVEIWKKDKT